MGIEYHSLFGLPSGLTIDPSSRHLRELIELDLDRNLAKSTFHMVTPDLAGANIYLLQEHSHG